MTPVTLLIEHVIDAGSIITLVGVSQTTGKRLAVVIDEEPDQRILVALKQADDGEAKAFSAQGLTAAVQFGLAVAGQEGGR